MRRPRLQLPQVLKEVVALGGKHTREEKSEMGEGLNGKPGEPAKDAQEKPTSLLK